MGYLILAIGCSTGISLIMRLSAKKAKGSLWMLAANYLVCLSIAASFTGVQNIAPNVPGLIRTLALGGLNGIFYLVAFVLYQHSVGKNGVVLASTFMKLGLLVPIGVSVIWQVPTAIQIIGFAIALVGIVMISGTGDGKGSFSPLLILLLVISGSANAMSQVYEGVGNSQLSSQFLLYTFGSALLFCVILALIKKERPTKYAILYGFLIGIPNYFSARFLLLSLGSVPAMIAHPMFSTASLVIVALFGIFAFQERLSKKQWAAMVLILASLILLNL